MKIIVTHASPDWDAIASVWIIRKFLPGWQDAAVEFVEPGERTPKVRRNPEFEKQVVLQAGGDEIIHVDTGNGPLDHHLDSDKSISAAVKSWEFVRQQVREAGNNFSENHTDALTRMMQVIAGYDHFTDVYYQGSADDYFDFTLNGLLDGYKLIEQNRDDEYILFGSECIEAIFHKMENKVWMEKELREKGIPFSTRYGKGIALETMNHGILKMAQRKGFVIVVRKDPRNGYLAVTSRPEKDDSLKIDLTLLYEQLKKMDPEATWYFHVSRQILLNGQTKNPKTKPSILTPEQVVNVIEKLYK